MVRGMTKKSHELILSNKAKLVKTLDKKILTHFSKPSRDAVVDELRNVNTLEGKKVTSFKDIPLFAYSFEKILNKLFRNIRKSVIASLLQYFSVSTIFIVSGSFFNETFYMVYINCTTSNTSGLVYNYRLKFQSHSLYFWLSRPFSSFTCSFFS